jgi:hypothetical protein
MNDLLLVKGQLTPICSKTHITYSFKIPENCRKLNAHFEYEPKALEDQDIAKKLILEGFEKYVEPRLFPYYQDKWESYSPLNNLITLSFDDPHQFRGSGHRHNPNQQYVLSEHEVSPGLVKGPIYSGVWKITVSVHCIVTETCNYKLHVWEGEETR